MNKLEQFRKEREMFTNPVSLPIFREASKLEVTEDRKIKGYPIVWNSVNDFGEKLVKGSCANSLNARGVGSKKNPIVVLSQHRTSEILCKPSMLIEDDYGLYFEGEIITNVSYAEDVYQQVRQGVLSQLSYGFGYIWDKVEYDQSDDSFVLKEIRLGEISLVTFAADENAQLRFSQYQSMNLLRDAKPEDIANVLKGFGAVTNTPSKNKESIFKIFN